MEVEMVRNQRGREGTYSSEVVPQKKIIRSEPNGSMFMRSFLEGPTNGEKQLERCGCYSEKELGRCGCCNEAYELLMVKRGGEDASRSLLVLLLSTESDDSTKGHDKILQDL